MLALDPLGLGLWDAGLGGIVDRSGWVRGPIAGAPGISGRVAGAVRISGPITVNEVSLTMAIARRVHPFNDYTVRLGPLAEWVGEDVVTPPPATGLEITLYVAATRDMRTATAIGALTTLMVEDTAASYIGTIEGELIATDAALLALNLTEGESLYIHARDATGSYAVSWLVLYEPTRDAMEEAA